MIERKCEMKTNRVILIAMVLILISGTISVRAAPSKAHAASQPWKVQLFKAAEDGVRNLSTDFAGNMQIPILSYSKVGTNYIYYAHPATTAVTGNCGPSNKWYCNKYFYGNLVPGSLSPMATMQKTDTHLLQWAFSTGSMIRGTTIELKNDMSYYTYSQQDLIQISKFGSSIVGTPSVQTLDGTYRMAVTIRDNTDLYGYKLIYMSYTIVSNSTCLSVAHYLCEVIDQSNGLNSMGAPSLKIAEDGTVGIAYYKAGSGLMYAYPHYATPSVPSNCGPDGNYWRCISLFADAGTTTVGQDVKLSLGKTTYNRGIAFSLGNATAGRYLFRAEYVGSGGNCGMDLNSSGVSVEAWKCHIMVFLGKFYQTYSIAIDPQGYAVIAYKYAQSDYSPYHLYIGYSKARLGLADSSWTEQYIDGVPDTTYATGAEAALSLNNSGLGFIGYLQEEDYALPDLKIAWQQFKAYLPITRR
jgi:hypothetical protein